jgi:hypothetical protein
MRKILFLAVLSLTILKVIGQRPCSQPEYRQFDFWIGDWEAYNPKGQKAGDSRISLILDSCTILEEWTSASVQKGIRYAGKSFNTYNTRKQRWQQYWIDNAGNTTEYFNGHFENGKMILQTDNIPLGDTATIIQKMTFHRLGPDKVRQHGETSRDAGKTWTTSFDLEYRRKGVGSR